MFTARVACLPVDGMAMTGHICVWRPLALDLCCTEEDRELAGKKGPETWQDKGLDYFMRKAAQVQAISASDITCARMCCQHSMPIAYVAVACSVDGSFPGHEDDEEDSKDSAE